jgi:xanthine dehydrogenase YagT iron-sulfur-binding subunit
MHLHVNGRLHETDAPDHATLLDVLRETLALTGTKRGCDRGECGACTVLRDGEPIYACLTLAAACEGASLLTIEGLAGTPDAAPLLETLRAHDAVQCGYCTPAQVLTAHALLAGRAADAPPPDRTAIAAGMSGVLCRCGTTAHLLDALEELARRDGAAGG